MAFYPPSQLSNWTFQRVVKYLTMSSGFLTSQSDDITKYQAFDACLYAAQNKDWVPPYPYCPKNALLPVEYQQIEKEIENVPNLASSTFQTEEQVFSEDRLANDSLGG